MAKFSELTLNGGIGWVYASQRVETLLNTRGFGSDDRKMAPEVGTKLPLRPALTKLKRKLSKSQMNPQISSCDSGQVNYLSEPQFLYLQNWGNNSIYPLVLLGD